MRARPRSVVSAAQVGHWYTSRLQDFDGDAGAVRAAIVGQHVKGHGAAVAFRDIGYGAIVGAGSVVTRDVPPYAIVAGNPAQVIKFRFSPESVASAQQSKWWQKDIVELTKDMDKFLVPFAC